MASEDDHHLPSAFDDDDDEEDLDDDVIDEDEDDEEDEELDPDEEEDDELDRHRTSAAVTVAIAQPSPSVTVVSSDPSFAITALPAVERKPIAAMDDSRRLFQRLWTDEDEIELLRGFLEYISTRGGINQHHDTGAFYDQIKGKFQLEFNKNQLVEKLRRLKKKYRNVMAKINAGKDYAFKSPHDQATFEISQKIWSEAIIRGANHNPVGGGGIGEEPGFDDDSNNVGFSLNNNHFTPVVLHHDQGGHNGGVDLNFAKGSRPRKRARPVKVEEGAHQQHQQPQFVSATPVVANSIPSLIEETVRSCLTPVFKELSAVNSGPRGLNPMMGGGLSPMMGFGLGGSAGPAPLGLFGGGGDVMDEKWRKQQILELEVYSKRLALVQDQIKSTLEELRSKGS